MGHPYLDRLRELDLPLGDYAVFGSGPLLARGWIDDAGDLDILARGPAWRRAQELGSFTYLAEWDVSVVTIGEALTVGTRWAIGDPDPDRLIDEAEVIDGTPCVRLREVVAYKRISDRRKDREHLALIAAHSTPANRCEFTTDRLTVLEWRSAIHELGRSLVDVVHPMLTSSTTAALPPEWSGDYDRARAEDWITGRDRESPTLLAVDHRTGRAVGLLILFEEPGAVAGTVDLRIGYLLDEAVWGHGYATELVAGLAGWAEADGAVASLIGGVAVDNKASSAVLRKAGFTVVDHSPDGHEDIFERRFTPSA